jgi:hypothetical protein
MILQQIAIGLNINAPTVGQDGMRINKMGKHIKTQLDYDLIETLAQELHRLDPDNAKLKHYIAKEVK